MDSHADASLSAAEITALRNIAATMLPADASAGVPGADDPAIFDDMLASLGRDLPMVRTALAAISGKANGTFEALERDRREALIAEWYADGGPAAGALGRVLLGAYYRDDRVLQSLGHEGRAPFPKGYTLEQGDWSLVEAVRHRPPLWRDDRKEATR